MTLNPVPGWVRPTLSGIPRRGTSFRTATQGRSGGQRRGERPVGLEPTDTKGRERAPGTEVSGRIQHPF